LEYGIGEYTNLVELMHIVIGMGLLRVGRYHCYGAKGNSVEMVQTMVFECSQKWIELNSIDNEVQNLAYQSCFCFLRSFKTANVYFGREDTAMLYSARFQKYRLVS